MTSDRLTHEMPRAREGRCVGPKNSAGAGTRHNITHVNININYQTDTQYTVLLRGMALFEYRQFSFKLRAYSVGYSLGLLYKVALAYRPIHFFRI